MRGLAQAIDIVLIDRLSALGAADAGAVTPADE